MRSFRSIAISIGVSVLQRPHLICLPFFALAGGVTWLVKDNFFFWDTTQLASQHAHFFYDNNDFSTFLLPDNMDSGHPPTFGYYLALVWKLFGKSLVVSHLAILPFLLGIVWQAWKLGERIVGEGWALWFLLMLSVCPVVAGQAVLVSPDIVLLFFFLMALNSDFFDSDEPLPLIWRAKRAQLFTSQLSLAILGLSTISMRGMMVAAGLFIFYFFKKFFFNKKHPLSINGVFSTISPFLLGGIAALSFLIYHFVHKGWIGFHANSPWMTAFERVNVLEFVKNGGILIWRLIDFGHLFLWFICIYGLCSIKKTLPTTRLLIALLIVLLIVLTPTLLIYKGLLAHRYLMPIYVVLILLTVKIISDLKHYKRQLVLALVALLGLASGNFWVYPQPISTGWDATLAHLPYYSLRNQMLEYINSQGIDYTDIGTAFPNQRDFETTDLTPPSLKNQFSTYNLTKNRFVLYSNVMNEFSEANLVELKTKWQAIKSLKKGEIEIVLFEKR
ncbi:MAG: hypothetical protein U5L45_24195 [Saprospiraceae bacterium]|nr:hypothetical protein [Saprospiraceae bacterium]